MDVKYDFLCTCVLIYMNYKFRNTLGFIVNILITQGVYTPSYANERVRNESYSYLFHVPK